MNLKAVLFDMDATIIAIDEDYFSKTYFSLFHKNCFSHYPFDQFKEVLLSSTNKVMIEKFPEEYTIDTFARLFAEAFEMDSLSVIELFRTFYSTDYNQLEKLVTPMNGAKKIIEHCQDLELQIVVATTPIFPEIAIRKRLEWGELIDYDYHLITHAENMHYSKPLREYYQEILEIIGCSA
ncbi:MAG: hypothetical protein EU542_08255, partial [Promethearchaeota archaeon]